MMKPMLYTRFGDGKIRAFFILFAIAMGTVLWLAPEAEAMHFDFSEDTTLDFDTTVIYGVSMRMKDPDEKLLESINADDGNRSFEKGDLVSNRLTGRSDLDLKYKNMGVFARGRIFYDDVYYHKNANDSPGTHNNGPIMGGPLTDHRDFTDATKDQQGFDAEVLDLFYYSDFYVGERAASFRIGDQVVSWGESLFTLGGISAAQSYADATMLNTPGAELKDIFLPTGQVIGKIDLINNLSFSGYYQWEWKRHLADTCGTFFSTADYGDVGGYHQIVVPGVPITADRIEDDDARDSGQYGVALRYLAQNLNDTEFGVYFLNYHEKYFQAKTVPGAGTPTFPDWTPILAGTPYESMAPMANFADRLGYYLGYQEDIKLYGASFSGQLGETNISGEVSYRKDFNVQVKDNSPLNPLGYVYEPFDVYQVLVSGLKFLGPVSFIDETMLWFEVGFNQVLNPDNLYLDAFAWGGIVRGDFSFLQVLPNLDLKIPVTFTFRPNGNSSLPLTFTEKRHSVSIGTEFAFRQDILFGFKYTDFLGDSEDDPKADRDNLSFSVKYTF
ncbi:MAG: DUF1302 domain-containing protein [Proteobacteria bacterium]|nr:DUF1302 domain-containing protein [Pseudomonadota bacterium]MBU4471628.1 DUF1302 domain-containing protein [Pseudomonadota bacterium]MCG2751110.1 DUF1302 domain-containing protein [Desulfobacteraceae bacterium]